MTGLQDGLKEYCPDCTYSQEDFPTTDLAKPGPPTWNGFLSANPPGKVQLVAGPYDFMSLPAAKTTQQAGRDDPLITGFDAYSEFVKAIETADPPTAAATIAAPFEYCAWAAMDNVARVVAGDEPWDIEQAAGRRGGPVERGRVLRRLPEAPVQRARHVHRALGRVAPDHAHQPVPPVERRPVTVENAAERPPILAITGIHKRFGRTHAVRGVDLVLREGEFVGLMGPNGAGKSTLIKILSGVYDADSGSISLDGQPVRNLAGRPEIGFVHQDLGLVDDDVGHGQPAARRQAAAARRAGAAPRSRDRVRPGGPRQGRSGRRAECQRRHLVAR